MTRQVGQQQFITFVKGLNTEAGPLTFPENSTIEDVNCVLTLKGSHKRRYGIKQEIEGKPLNVGYSDILYDGRAGFKDYAINTYTWKAPGNVGAKTFLVLQVTDRLLFYDISENTALPLTSTSLNVSLESLIINSRLFKESGCSFSSGKGKLFVCGKGLEPCYVSYNSSSNTVSVQKLEIKVRDTVGVDDGLDNNTQPGTLSEEHLYNLINQGWLYQGTSSITGSNMIATVSNLNRDVLDVLINGNPWGANYPCKIFVDGAIVWSGTSLVTFNSLPPAQRAYLTYTRPGNNSLQFKVDSGHTDTYLGKSVYFQYEAEARRSTVGGWEYYTATYMSTTGVFSYSDGTSQPNTPYNTYYTSVGRYPSNAQQWFVGREVQQQINVNEVKNFDFGNQRAPRGRCIIDAFNPDRTVVVPDLSEYIVEDVNRVIDTAFMGGRVFYLRQNQLLYSQVIEDIKQAGMCYTEGDPTSEDGFDVVDTDGGVITITDMGDAIALFELQNGLAVFAKNGIWLVTGLSSDEGFKATGYSVRKLSNLECVSKNSIVNVQGAPLFWTTSGIYVIVQRDYVGYDVQSLSDTTIQSKYVEIPKHNLKNVKGIYNSGAQRVAWFYDVTDENESVEKERETKALIYDVRLQAFYELDMDKEENHPFLCAAFNTSYLSFISLDDEVYDNEDHLVYDNGGNIVYSQEAIKNTDLTDVKYLAFEKKLIPAGYQLKFDGKWYTRYPSEDNIGDYVQDYAWKDIDSDALLFTFDVNEPTPFFVTNNGARFYRAPEYDDGGKYAWSREDLHWIMYTNSETPSRNAVIYRKTSNPAKFQYNGVWYSREQSEDLATRRPQYDETDNNFSSVKYAWYNSSATPQYLYTAFSEPTPSFQKTIGTLDPNPPLDPNRYYKAICGVPQLTGITGPTFGRGPSYASMMTCLRETWNTPDDPVSDLQVGDTMIGIDPIMGDLVFEGTVTDKFPSYSVELFTVPESVNDPVHEGFATAYQAETDVSFTAWYDVVWDMYPDGNLPMYKRVSQGTFNYVGMSEDNREGFSSPTNVVFLTSCNFDNIYFKDWDSIDYTSTFTTGANTCGDSFLTKDVIYLTTQLSRTEAVGYQGNIGNESSCLMQMKWNFEDTAFSHKWTTPVQIYRARRLFAPTVDDPNFDDISIRMPVITTKHKVRGNGKALQIKFTSEPGKNFEVLGWNLVVGARD